MTTTLTFGDVAENHVAMEQIGVRAALGEGFSLLDLMRARRRFQEAGVTCEILTLSGDAGVLIIRNGLTAIMDPDALLKEQGPLEKDKKAFMYGRVVNKKARWNLCFATEGHGPCYEEGKGRVISYKDVPLLATLVATLPAWFGEKAIGLNGEGNYYYNPKICGIGYHGDTERRKVIAVRLGAPMSLHFQGYKYNLPSGPHHEVVLGHGDLYMMSEKAVGTDWKSSSILTFRHAAGCASFTKL
jgi:hypothetical protein